MFPAFHCMDSTTGSQINSPVSVVSINDEDCKIQFCGCVHPSSPAHMALFVELKKWLVRSQKLGNLVILKSIHQPNGLVLFFFFFSFFFFFLEQ